MSAQTVEDGSSFTRMLDALTAAGSPPTAVRGWHAEARCPVHEDRSPSLHIDWREGRTLVRCRSANCAADPEAITGAIGLRVTDLFDTPPARPADPSRATQGRRAPAARPAPARPAPAARPADEHRHTFNYRSPECVHQYADADGVLLGEARRFRCTQDGCRGKRMSWRRPKVGGGWETKQPDELPLYRVPEVLAAAAAGGVVYVVEGERDADELAALGLTATTAPNGGGAPWADRYTAALAGARVVLVPDRDRGGVVHMARVRDALAGAGVAVESVRVAASGKDVCDHLAAGRAVEDMPAVDLAALAAELGAELPAAAGTEPAREQGAGRRRHLAAVNGRGGGDQDGGDTPPPARIPAGAWPVPTTGRVAVMAVTTGPHEVRGLYLDGWDHRGGRVAELPYVVARMPNRGANGEVRAWRYLLALTLDGPRTLVGDGDLKSGAWVGMLGLNVPADRGIHDAAVTAVRTMAQDVPPSELAARWEAGRLVLPPAEALPAGYLQTAGSEDEARRAWAELGRLACEPGAENLALNLGAAFGAPYVGALSAVRPVSFALFGMGQPRRGKTTNVNVAAAWYGSPREVNPPISESGIASGDQLADLGVLPFFRDEAHSAGWDGRAWHSYWMRALNGAGRRRSSGDGSGIVRAQRQWWGVQFMSGNMDPRFGATDGVMARVITLTDPHLPSRAAADRITRELLPNAYGWPVQWQAADHPTPEQFAAELAAALAELGEVPDGVQATVSECLALMIAGAVFAGRMFGVPELPAAAVRSARRVLDVLADTLADAAVSPGDQLAEAVWSDVQAHPALYPPRAEYEAMRERRAVPDQGEDTEANGQTFLLGVPRLATVHGFTWEHGGRPVVSITRARFTDLTADSDYAPGEALADLLGRHLLVKTPSRRGFQHRIKISGAWDLFYTFRPVQNADPEPDAHTDVCNDDPGAHTPHGSDLQSSHVAHIAHTPEHAHVREGAAEGDTVPEDRALCPVCGEPMSAPELGHATCEPAAAGSSASSAGGTAPSSASSAGTGAAQRPAEAREQGQAQDRGAGAGYGRQRGARGRDGAVAAAAGAVDKAREDIRTGKASGHALLRLLRELAPRREEVGRDGKRFRRAPYLMPPTPEVVDQVRVPDAVERWERPFDGPTLTLDRSGAWLSAASTVLLGHCELVHTPDLDACTDAPLRPGYYLVPRMPWDEDGTPDPWSLTGDRRREQDSAWVPEPTATLFRELARAGRWGSSGELDVLDAWTAPDSIRMDRWAREVNGLRAWAIDTYGRDSDEYEAVKIGYGSAVTMMIGSPQRDGTRTYRGEVHRPDWGHAITAHANATLWRRADQARELVTAAGRPELGPVAVRNKDELVIPAEALELVTAPAGTDRDQLAGRLQVDPTGVRLGSFKVKPTDPAAAPAEGR